MALEQGWVWPMSRHSALARSAQRRPGSARGGARAAAHSGAPGENNNNNNIIIITIIVVAIETPQRGADAM